jgi:hypothetical protein
MNSKGRARVYCSSRSKSKACDFRGTFLDIYESQIEWYLTNFVIPDDYQKKILDAHRRLVEAYVKSQDVESQREVLETVLARLKEQYRWGHISQQEYLREYQQTETQLRQLTPVRDEEDKLKRLAHFLFNVADAWRAATQEQRNKLARTLFEEIRIDSGGKVVAVKPKAEFEPFFKLSYECHAKDIASDPEGDWGLGFKLFQPVFV